MYINKIIELNENEINYIAGGDENDTAISGEKTTSLEKESIIYASLIGGVIALGCICLTGILFIAAVARTINKHRKRNKEAIQVHPIIPLRTKQLD